MIRVLVCRVGADPVVEEVEHPFYFTKNLLNEGLLEAKLIGVGEGKVVVYWDEEADMKKLPFNRDIPARAPEARSDVKFVVDMRKGPPEAYAKPGQMGFWRINGHFVVTKADSNGDHVSLDQREIDELMLLLALPKCKQCRTVPLAYPGAVFCGAGCSAENEMGISHE